MMLRRLRVWIAIGVVATFVTGMTAMAFANAGPTGLVPSENAALVQRLNNLAARMDDDTAERLAQIFYELSQMFEPEELMTILQLLAVRIEQGPSSVSEAAPVPASPDVRTERVAISAMEVPSLPRDVEFHISHVTPSHLVPPEKVILERLAHAPAGAWEHPLPHLFTDSVVATDIAFPRLALLAQATAARQVPLVQRAPTQADIPSLIQQLNSALRNTALEWRLPDGTRLQPRIVIEMVPVHVPAPVPAMNYGIGQIEYILIDG